MSRDLPYFKFFTSEWLNGDITLLDLELQGQFINVCAYYWHRECQVTLKQVDRKFGAITDLIDEGLIEVAETDEYVIRIKFLDEQFSEFSTRKKKLSDAGKKGAERKKALNQPPLNHPSTTREDKDKEKIKTIEDRKKDFQESLAKHLEKYDKKMLNEFYSYWTEHGDDDKKMRYEKQTSFSIGRRLGTWKRNEKNYGFKGNTKDNRATTTKSERQSFD